MWALKSMPFKVDDSRVRMWADSLKEIEGYGWAHPKLGEWQLTPKGRIARAVYEIDFLKSEKEVDLKAKAMREHHKGHGVHPGPNPGFQTWPFTELVKYLGFHKAMAIAIDYNSSIHETVCGSDFKMYFKTKVLFKCPDEEFKCDIRGEKAGYNEDGLHYRSWEARMESKGYSLDNGGIKKIYLIE